MQCLVCWKVNESKAANRPNLTNRIAGVLTRFREGEVAFMTDIESMYYQMRVHEYQQKSIKFLVEKSEHRGKPSDFAICTHVLDGVSSTSFSNHALKRTAT